MHASEAYFHMVWFKWTAISILAEPANNKYVKSSQITEIKH